LYDYIFLPLGVFPFTFVVDLADALNTKSIPQIGHLPFTSKADREHLTIF
jgi:hypothetical protein